MCLYPNYSGAFGPATPKSPLPQGDARSAFEILHVHNVRQTRGPETTHRSNVFEKQGDPETSLGVPFVSSTLTGTIEGNQTVREGLLKQVFPQPV